MAAREHSGGPRKARRPASKPAGKQTKEFVTRLTPDQARDVLGRLLEGHPALLSEAEALVGVDGAADAQ